MDDQKSLEAQLLGDMSYDDPRKHAQQPAVDPRLAGASAVVLDDMTSGAPQPQQPSADQRLAGASAVVLDDMSGAAQQPVRPAVVELTDEQVAILQSQRAAQGLPPYTDAEIQALKDEFVERQLAAQRAVPQVSAEAAAAQQAAAAALLQEPEDYNAPEKRVTHEVLPQVDASALLEEPAPEPVQRPVFNQSDVEEARKAAAKRATESLKEQSGPKTEEEQKRARMEMERLRVQQLSDLAQAGFKQSIVMTAIGFVCAVCMFLFASCGYAPDVTSDGFFALADKCFTYLSIALAVLSITIVLRVTKLKGFTSGMFIISSILMVVPGIIVMLHKRGADSFGLCAVSYAISIVGCFVVTFIMSTSDKLSAYYARKEITYD